jgi:flavodoxin
MKVIYESRKGTTKKLAEAIAETLKIDIWDVNDGIDISKIQEDELLFIGSGCYYGKCGRKVIEFIRELKRSGKKVRMALFGTSGQKDAAVYSLRKVANKNGYLPLGDALNVQTKMFIFIPKPLKEQHINSVINFAQRLTKN